MLMAERVNHDGDQGTLVWWSMAGNGIKNQEQIMEENRGILEAEFFKKFRWLPIGINGLWAKNDGEKDYQSI